jgi:putative flippase GtrA
MNALTDYHIPEWISIAFLIAIPLPFILITLFVFQESKQTQYKSAYQIAIVFFIFYLLYITFASLNGWFNQVSLPPKVLLLTTFPFAFLLFALLGNSKVYKTMLEKAAIENIVKLHFFRLIGVFFILLAMNDALPKTFALIAGIGDMATAITSVFVVKAIKSRKSYAKKLTYYWNLFGTIDILFTAIGANVLTKISIDTGAMGVDSLAFFPFCIIPAFAPPMILFLHWSIFKKLKNFSL